MPAWNEILNELNSTSSAFEDLRYKYLQKLFKKTGRNIIVYYSGWLQKKLTNTVDLIINDSDKTGFMTVISKMDTSKGLDLILHTPGGEVGATEHLVEYLKDVFNNDIRVIVPQIAMSAGTMIALAAKEICMGNYSNLGPIDPQIGGLPAQGILDEYEKAKAELKVDPKTEVYWKFALSKYPPTLIGECEKAIKWSDEFVKKWLKEGMFKGNKDNEKIIENIINELSNNELTKSHSRHISLKKLKELKLKIIDLGDKENKELQDCILSLHHSLIITLSQTRAFKIVENHLRRSFISNTEH